jgi:hypothetical protein
MSCLSGYGLTGTETPVRAAVVFAASDRSRPDDSGWRSRVRALPDSLIVNGLFVRCQPGDFKFGGLGIRDWSEWILIVPLPRGT